MSINTHPATSITALPRSQSVGDLLRRSAARYPDKTAIIFNGREETYSEFNQAVNQFAHHLASLGLEKGDCVVLLSRNHRDFILTRFATAKIGVVLAPLNFMLNSDDLAYLMSDCKPKLIVAQDSLVATMDNALGNLDLTLYAKYFIDFGETVPEGWQSLQESGYTQGSTAEPDTVVDDEAPVQIMYTSGTESRPKGVQLSSRSLYHQYTSCIINGDMSADDIELHSLPLYHCAQLDVLLTPGLYLGATNIILSVPEADNILATIEKYRVSKFFAPPTIWIALLAHPDFDTRDLSSLKKGYYGASIMPKAVVVQIKERLPNMDLYNLYGQTEMSPLATLLGPEDQLRKLGSAGKPVLNVETLIVDDDDQPLSSGTVGEIVHRGPHVMNGYLNQPDKTAETFRNGWLHSGDLGYFDEEGYLYVVDRKNDMIKTGGENVSSREVEEVIYTHPAVQEVAIFGLPDDKWIEVVSAAIILNKGADVSGEDIMEFCKAKISHYKVPKKIFFTEALPKNASGKILKRNLRELYSA